MFKNILNRDRERDEREKKLGDTVTALMRTVESQRRLIITHENHIADLGNQNEELRKSITITRHQKAAYMEQTKVALESQEQFNRLALWLRNNKAAEIAAGKHHGMDLVSAILLYLGGTIESSKGVDSVRPN
jgi:hypothetical protein